MRSVKLWRATCLPCTASVSNNARRHHYLDNFALYTGGGTADAKFLNKYFQSSLIGAGPCGCGTNKYKGRAEFLKKTSQD